MNERTAPGIATLEKGGKRIRLGSASRRSRLTRWLCSSSRRINVRPEAVTRHYAVNRLLDLDHPLRRAALPAADCLRGYADLLGKRGRTTRRPDRVF
jgi:hypothetical protein